MSKRSPLIHRLVLVLSALAALGAAAWAGLRAFEPVPIPPVPPPRPAVTFDPRADIRGNPLFGTLQAVIRGEIDIGQIGRSNPFASPSTETPSSPDAAAARGSVEEVSLGGAQVFALAPAVEGGVLALVGGQTANGAQTYEIRRFAPDTEPATVGRWNAPPAGSDPSTPAPLTPVAVRQSGDGKIWLFSVDGRVGTLQSDGRPVWGPQPILPALSGAGDLDGVLVDDIGRLWVTDGAQLFVGNGSGFQTIDLPVALSEEDRAAVVSGVADARPWRLQSLADGRVGVMTPSFAFTFQLSLQGKPEVTGAPSGARFLAFGPGGALWSAREDGSGLIRQEGDATRTYEDTRVLPKQAVDRRLLLTASRETLSALDYNPAGTVLWRTAGNDWVASVIPPQGTQPEDQAARIVADGQGNVWALMQQRGLLLVRPPTGP